MRDFAARLRDSESLWTAAIFGGLCFVLASGSPDGTDLATLLAEAESAALAALLSLWVARTSGSRRRGLAIALAALFTTPLLPYAYSLRDATGALGLLCGAFLAIGPARVRTPFREAGICVAGAAVLLAQISNLFLLPVLVWLIAFGARRGAAERRGSARPRFLIGVALLLAALAFSPLAHPPVPLVAEGVSGIGGSGGSFGTGETLWVHSPIDWLVHLHGLTLSLNKGLLLFAPLALLGLWRAFRGAVDDRRVAQFALYSTACLLLPCAALTRWSDATWGPHALLAAIAPALLAFALSRAERERRGGNRRWILAAILLGLAVNTLGAAMPQEALSRVAGLTTDEPASELAKVQFDPRFNHPRVNAELLGRWVWATAFRSASPAGARPSDVEPPAPRLLRLAGPVEPGERWPLLGSLLLLGGVGWALLIAARAASPA
ncbi:MAG: hypothetical protein ABI639_05860 [Thermoanaerobaculia bacterium]